MQHRLTPRFADRRFEISLHTGGTSNHLHRRVERVQPHNRVLHVNEDGVQLLLTAKAERVQVPPVGPHAGLADHVEDKGGLCTRHLQRQFSRTSGRLVRRSKGVPHRLFQYRAERRLRQRVRNRTVI